VRDGFYPAPLPEFDPERCACGEPGFAELLSYHTHQVIELPVIRPTVTHWM
jgi:hypothetical protein